MQSRRSSGGIFVAGGPLKVGSGNEVSEMNSQ